MAAPYKTRAYYMAQAMAYEAENDGLRTQLEVAQRRIHELEQSMVADVKDRSSVMSMRQKLARCKELNAQGVPCKVHRGLLVHSFTHAPLT